MKLNLKSLDRKEADVKVGERFDPNNPLRYFLLYAFQHIENKNLKII